MFAEEIIRSSLKPPSFRKVVVAIRSSDDVWVVEPLGAPLTRVAPGSCVIAIPANIRRDCSRAECVPSRGSDARGARGVLPSGRLCHPFAGVCLFLEP